MSTLRNPVGPQPPVVYWRRRLLVLLGIVAVVVVVILIVSRPGSGSGSPSPSSSSSANPSDKPTDEPTDEEAAGDPTELCDPSVIVLEPITDADSYPAGVQPMLSMSITNTGAAACTFDVGTGAQLYSIVSGADPIWNSKDCQQAPTSTPQILEPGKTLSTTPFPWDRTRSSASTCTSERPPVVAGGATYRLSVSLGEVESASDKPFILN
jgi:hypothetical protein